MKFTIPLSYVSGYLRHGQLEGTLSQEDYEEWVNLDPQNQKLYLQEIAEVKITDWSLEDYGAMGEIQWHE